MSRKFTDEEIEAILSYSALDESEKITSKPAGERETDLLAVDLHCRHADAMECVMLDYGDVIFHSPYDYYVGVVSRNGFECVRRIDFKAIHHGCKEPESDVFEIWVDLRRGLLLSFDTYHGKISGANVYYNWQPTTDDYYKFTSCGHWHYNKTIKDEDFRPQEGVWIGSHDAREALIFNLHKLENNGRFITPWVEMEHMDLSWWSNKDEPKDFGPNWLENYEEFHEQQKLLISEDIRAKMGIQVKL